MTDLNCETAGNPSNDTQTTSAARQAWSRPQVQRLSTGEAETNPGGGNDSNFQTS